MRVATNHPSRRRASDWNKAVMPRTVIRAKAGIHRPRGGKPSTGSRSAGRMVTALIPPPPRSSRRGAVRPSSAASSAGAGDRVGQVEILDRIGESPCALGPAPALSLGGAHSSGTRPAARQRRMIGEHRLAQLRRSCRTAAARPSASESARRIDQSSRASPGGSTAFSANWTRPSRLTWSAVLLAVGGARQDHVGRCAPSSPWWPI